ncbi:ABC-type branched-chain amino acid transport system, periplasmic component [Xanthobacter versatilis]|uniref:ABC-type branched-chain amino acid transport system, periplasmic component n=1 Tax=Xanthobacter autotrophicus (strain ATCC BAA-1158 / Py2) TaxID=78245 RepID=A7IMQ8_XANP2|nr:ABC-type branched-chain amino acid transport system, periplasmic component [Xanthobacter autotrophicus Py2]
MAVKGFCAGLIGAALLAAAGTAAAEVPARGIKVGVLTDLSGVYTDLVGQGSIEAAKMAVEDFGGSIDGKPITIVSADGQNKADVGASIARRWIDEDNVDVIVDVPNTAIALAVQEITRAKNKVLLNTGAGSTVFTNKACSPTSFHWVYDSYAMANGTARSVVAEGGDSWYFLTADYTFGQSLERDASEVVRANGGKVLGSVRHPLGSSDFSSFLLQAQASGAKVIAFANGGADLINSIKQAHEFGIGSDKQRLAAMVIFITDIHALGLAQAQGLLLTSGFYWDMDAQNRAWSERWAKRMGGRKPTMLHAGVYSAVLHFLRSAKAANSVEGNVVADKMRELPIDDFFARNGSIRPDGRMIHDMYLAQVKTPAESKGPWDYLKIVRTIPAAEAFQPLSRSECPLVKK